MSDYTPTTDEVREQWRELWSYDHSENGSEQRNAQFDRWLNAVKAEAWDEGFDAGERDVFEHDERHEWDKPHTCIQNPYREAVTE